MSLRTLTRFLVTILFPIALFCTIYLYLYPIFHNGCAFPLTTGSGAAPAAARLDALTQHWPFSALVSDEEKREQRRNHHPRAPFRLLVLADPQLEGDSSLPDPEDGFLRRLAQHRERVLAPDQKKSHRKQVIKTALKDLFFSDIPELLQGWRKRLDLLGNDYYLAHIFRTLHWWTDPTHVTVLGDLLGSQWVTDEEFEARAWRYWNRVFASGRRVEDELIDNPQGGPDSHNLLGMKVTMDHEWKDRVINIAGNHDIGYAGDVSKARIARFERHFGRADWDIRFNLPVSEEQNIPTISPSLHLIVLNDLILDTPGFDPDIQSASYNHLNSIITQRSQPVEDKGSFTLLLTHIPLYKPEGNCIDAPFFDFHHSDDSAGAYRSGGLKEQNHLSEHVSRSGILEGIYGMSANPDAAGKGKGRKGLILTGHDHEGCDVWHYLPESATAPPTSGHRDDEEVKFGGWESIPWRSSNISASHTGVREITLRSMMGEFGGNAGLLSLWFDWESEEWQYEIQMCRLGIQHFWWGVHILDCITISMALWWLVASHLCDSPTSVEGDKVAPERAVDGQVVTGKRE
ncbi:hypothetical protein GJ744_000804 [Endocarpon pusillum]|uniref:Calcineurin-like phosphoesterase domain-containing protein n=1 Tax=Endocarpon pusillum TaxID=364733 RepID=A0A8H7ANU3_9EURO|nr:hypothetical protein GJ744_000804 [Endocarpon pusillum]